jgi:hypothetical protein
MDVMVEHRMLKPNNGALVINSDQPLELLEKMKAFTAAPDPVWFKDRDLI